MRRLVDGVLLVLFARFVQLLLPEAFLSAFGQLFGRRIADVSGQRPNMAEGVGHDAVAVAPEHVHRGHLGCRAGVQGTLDRGVTILDVAVNRHRCPAEGFGRVCFAVAVFGEVIGEKDGPTANADLRVHDPLAIGSGHPANLCGIEGFLVELDGLRAGAAHEMRNQAVTSAM